MSVETRALLLLFALVALSFAAGWWAIERKRSWSSARMRAVDWAIGFGTNFFDALRSAYIGSPRRVAESLAPDSH
jgi:hypothetical protein